MTRYFISHIKSTVTQMSNTRDDEPEYYDSDDENGNESERIDNQYNHYRNTERPSQSRHQSTTNRHNGRVDMNRYFSDDNRVATKSRVTVNNRPSSNRYRREKPAVVNNKRSPPEPEVSLIDTVKSKLIFIIPLFVIVIMICVWYYLRNKKMKSSTAATKDVKESSESKLTNEDVQIKKVIKYVDESGTEVPVRLLNAGLYVEK